MRYKVIWRKQAEKGLKEIDDRIIAENIKYRVENHLASHPIQNGKPLWGKWQGFWRYPIDDYRVIYEIRQNELLILVVKVGSRSEVYKKD